MMAAATLVERHAGGSHAGLAGMLVAAMLVWRACWSLTPTFPTPCPPHRIIGPLSELSWTPPGLSRSEEPPGLLDVPHVAVLMPKGAGLLPHKLFDVPEVRAASLSHVT